VAISRILSGRRSIAKRRPQKAAISDMKGKVFEPRPSSSAAKIAAALLTST
jgi:hypothetical protein